jgi:16S rRNA G966 N2-methylase RsmD
MTVVFPWPLHPAAELFPLIDDSELAGLAEDVREHGLIEPVWLYKDPERGTVLLDGRNRARACERAGIDVTEHTRFYAGGDPIGFSISQNMKRRHLTAGQKAAVGSEARKLLAEEIEAARRRAIAESATVQERDEQGRMTADRRSSGESSPPHREARKNRPRSHRGETSAKRAAAAAGASERSIERFERVERDAPDLAAKVKSGELALDRAERIIRDREAEAKRIEQAKVEAAAQPEPLRVDIRHGDFREVLADLTNVDAIITDPPYPAEFLPLLGDMAEWADKVLTPDGVMAVLIGQTHLPEVYRLLSGHRTYRWTACYLTDGPAYVSHPRKVQSNWKPLIVYGGGPRFADVIRSEGSDANAKVLHKWGQDYNAFHTIIERLTSRGQTVVDPFMGSGTTLLAAKALGRHTIGCDTELEHVQTAQGRLA